MKKLVELWALEDENFLALIVPMKTGITWGNQAAGVMCHHPEIEGLYLPLTPHWLANNSAENASNISRPFSVKVNTDIVADFLKHNPELEKRFEIDPRSKVRAEEAWLPVRIRKRKRERYDWDVLAPFYGKPAILTYSNSD